MRVVKATFECSSNGYFFLILFFAAYYMSHSWVQTLSQNEKAWSVVPS